MKKILFRKLLSDYLIFFTIALFSSSIIIWVFQAVNFLDIMIEDGRDYIIYLNFSFLHFPKIFSKLFPFVLFFTLFYVTIKYETNNELIIFWNFGLNKIELINFILKISILMMLIQLILTSFIVPKSQDMARSFLRNSTVNFYGNFIKPQRFNDTISGVTIYSEKKNTDGDLYNIYIKREINKDEFQLTYAKKGIFSEINNNPFLILFDGETISGKNNNITNFSFSRSDFSLKNMDANTTTYKKTQELSSINLLKCLKKIKDSNVSDGFEYKEIENCHSKNFRSLLKEFYKRIIIPIYIPILMLIPFLLIISSKESSQYSKLKFFTFFIGLLVIIFSEITIRFISENIGDNLFISSVPILVLFLLYFIFLKKFNLKIK